MNHYRIRFFLTRGIYKKQYVDTTADKAKCFQVFLNNRFLGEFTKMKNAIELIIAEEGEDQELNSLLENIAYVQCQNSIFITAGITYSKKHGVRIEQKIEGVS
jgi:hypothetical protein